MLQARSALLTQQYMSIQRGPLRSLRLNSIILASPYLWERASSKTGAVFSPRPSFPYVFNLAGLRFPAWTLSSCRRHQVGLSCLVQIQNSVFLSTAGLGTMIQQAPNKTRPENTKFWRTLGKCINYHEYAMDTFSSLIGIAFNAYSVPSHILIPNLTKLCSLFFTDIKYLSRTEHWVIKVASENWNGLVI